MLSPSNIETTTIAFAIEIIRIHSQRSIARVLIQKVCHIIPLFVYLCSCAATKKDRPRI
jgi:hypothetical protein